jgi:hypothetical protein
MKKTKLILLKLLFLFLVTVEFFLGFIGAIIDHWSDAVTAIQKQYEAIRKAES